MAVVARMNNETEASQFMVKAVDFDPNTRTPMPDVQSPEELMKFGISAERHHRYLYRRTTSPL